MGEIGLISHTHNMPSRNRYAPGDNAVSGCSQFRVVSKYLLPNIVSFSLTDYVWRLLLPIKGGSGVIH